MAAQVSLRGKEMEPHNAITKMEEQVLATRVATSLLITD